MARPFRKNDVWICCISGSSVVTIEVPCTVIVTGTRKSAISQPPRRGYRLIATNRYPRLGAWLIVLFLVPVTITVHGVWMFTAPDRQMQQIQTSFFLKGVAMAGAALLITQLGVRRADESRATEPRATRQSA